MTRCFSLNTKTSETYYSVLFLLSITSLYSAITYLVFKERPTKKHVQQLLVWILSIIIFHLLIDPRNQVTVLNDEHNNDHISNV
jgi:hypothetical protein